MSKRGDQRWGADGNCVAELISVAKSIFWRQNAMAVTCLRDRDYEFVSGGQAILSRQNSACGHQAELGTARGSGGAMRGRLKPTSKRQLQPRNRCRIGAVNERAE